jgi:hypothetical protein
MAMEFSTSERQTVLALRTSSGCDTHVAQLGWQLTNSRCGTLRAFQHSRLPAVQGGAGSGNRFATYVDTTEWGVRPCASGEIAPTVQR